MDDGALLVWSIQVRDHWIDYNGHLNDGYFAVAFSQATDAALDRLGIGEAYHGETGHSLFTVESHIRYLDQVHADSQLDFDSTVIGADRKRLRLWHEMWVHGTLRATQEVMLLHVNEQAGRTAQFPDHVARLLENHSAPPPEHAGRGIAAT